jgi:hypothetical protein
MTREKTTRLTGSDFLPIADALGQVPRYDRCRMSWMRCTMYRRWLGRGSNEREPMRPGADNVQRTAEVQGTAIAHETARVDQIVTALAMGALLGAVAVMPYDQLLGISDSACTILRSVVTTAVWAGLSSQRPQDLTFDAATLQVGTLQMRTPRRWHARETQIRRAGGTRQGNQNRFQDVLKVRAGSILAHHGG